MWGSGCLRRTGYRPEGPLQGVHPRSSFRWVFAFTTSWWLEPRTTLFADCSLDRPWVCGWSGFSSLIPVHAGMRWERHDMATDSDSIMSSLSLARRWAGTASRAICRNWWAAKALPHVNPLPRPSFSRHRRIRLLGIRRRCPRWFTGECWPSCSQSDADDLYLPRRQRRLGGSDEEPERGC